MKKVILEEIESMKYLLGYKRGIVISEQDVDNSVDPKLVASAEQPAAAATPAAATPPVTTGPIKMGVKNPRVQVLQQLLNDKFQAGLTADGLYGPKTADAIYKNIIAISKTQLKPVGPVTAAPQVVQQPGAQITANTNIPQR